MNINAFINQNKIRMTATWADANPNMGDMPSGSSHWKCVFSRGRSRMTVYFSMGPAHSREPEAADVLDCLASDASGIENAQSFEEWASEYGYDPDSRKAEKTFNVCEKQAASLKQFLGEDAYKTLLWDTERL